jgi:ABC-type Fe3+/spermidine/putrescine transport system ATPase subunit
MRGEIFGLLGPNGAGKTTTIRLMATTLSPTAGDVLVGGFSVMKEPDKVRRLIGVCPQEIALYQELSALDNLVAISVFTSLTLAPLGGCWWPLFIMPRWMRNLARFTPHAWANLAFGKLIYYAAPPGAVVVEMLVLLAFGAAFAALAFLRFRVSD